MATRRADTTVIVRVEKVVAEGDGLGRLEDGRVVFVEGALPGETVRASYVMTHKKYDELRTVEVLSASPDRVEPPCAHFSICGGCSMQHLSREAQITFKQGVLAEHFRHFGGLEPEAWLPPLVDPEPAYRRKARLGVKYVPQDKKVFSDLTVRENLELASFGVKDHDWTPVLTYFPKLNVLMDRKAGYLSGGERQMLMIGRAILGQPKVLLIDEPTEGLAPSIVAHLRTVFTELARSMALVIVEQNLPLVCAIADRVCALRDGRIVATLQGQDAIRPEHCEPYL